MTTSPSHLLIDSRNVDDDGSPSLLQSVDNSSAEAALALLALSPVSSARLPSLPVTSATLVTTVAPHYVLAQPSSLLFGQHDEANVVSAEQPMSVPEVSFDSSPQIETSYPQLVPYASFNTTVSTELTSADAVAAETIPRRRPAETGDSDGARTADAAPRPTSNDRPSLTIEGEGGEKFQFRCICDLGYLEGDATIACDKCDVWQHMLCMGVEPGAVPEIYHCDVCRPRGVVDVENARKKQEAARMRYERETKKVVGGNRPRRASDGHMDIELPPVTANDDALSLNRPPPVVSETVALPRGRRKSGTAAQKATRRPPLSLGQVLMTAYSSPKLGQIAELDEDDIPRGDAWGSEYLSLSRDYYPDPGLRSRLDDMKNVWMDAGEDIIVDIRSRSSSPSRRPSSEPGTIPSCYPPLVLSSLPTLPNITIKVIPLSAPLPDLTSYPRPPQYGLFAGEIVIPPETLILDYRSVIIKRADYVADPTSQWPRLGVPKPCVRFIPPPLSVALDAREWGNEARFARTSCHPNCVIRPIIVQGELRFGIVSLRELAKREEILLGWDWEDESPVHWLADEGDVDDPAELREGRRRCAELLDRLDAAFLACACNKAKDRDCAIFWLSKVARGEGGPFREAHRKGRKVKRPDLGPMIGVLRGWDPADGGELAKWIRAPRLTSPDDEESPVDEADAKRSSKSTSKSASASRSGSPSVLRPTGQAVDARSTAVSSPLTSLPSSVDADSSPIQPPPRKRRKIGPVIMSSPGQPQSPFQQAPSDEEDDEMRLHPKARKRRMQAARDRLFAEPSSASSGAYDLAASVASPSKPFQELRPPLSPAFPSLDVEAVPPLAEVSAMDVDSSPIEGLDGSAGLDSSTVLKQEEADMNLPSDTGVSSIAGELVQSPAEPGLASASLVTAPTTNSPQEKRTSPDMEQAPDSRQPVPPDLPSASEEPIQPLSPVPAPPVPQPTVRKWSFADWAAARRRGEVGRPITNPAAAPAKVESPDASQVKPAETSATESAAPGTSEVTPATVIAAPSINTSVPNSFERLASEHGVPETGLIPREHGVTTIETMERFAPQHTAGGSLENDPAVHNTHETEPIPGREETIVEEVTSPRTVNSAMLAPGPMSPTFAINHSGVALPATPDELSVQDQTKVHSLVEPIISTDAALDPVVLVNPATVAGSPSVVSPPPAVYNGSPSPIQPQPNSSFPVVEQLRVASEVQSSDDAATSVPAYEPRQEALSNLSSMDAALQPPSVGVDAGLETVASSPPSELEPGQSEESPRRVRESRWSDREDYRPVRSSFDLAGERPPPQPSFRQGVSQSQHAFEAYPNASASPTRQTFRPEPHPHSPGPFLPRSPRMWPLRSSPPRGPRTYSHADSPPPAPPAPLPPPQQYGQFRQGPRNSYHPPLAPRAEQGFRPEYDPQRPPIGPRALYNQNPFQGRGGFNTYGRGGPGQATGGPPRGGYPQRGHFRGRRGGQWRGQYP